MSGDPGASGAAPGMLGDGGARAQRRCGPGALKLVVKNSFLEVVDVEPHLKRAQSDSDLWSSSGRCPSLSDDDAWLAPSRDRLPDPSGTASTSIQEFFADAVDGHSSRGGSVDEDSHRRMRGLDGRSSSSRSSTAAHQDKHAGLTVDVVDDRAVGSDLEGRGKRDSGQAELAKLEWSRGTERHATGKCKPCLYRNAKAGCKNGVNCMFCHAPHVKKHRVRPSKTARQQCRKFAEMLDNVEGQQDTEAHAGPPDTDICLAAMGMCASEQKYMRSILAARSRQPSVQQAAAGGGRPANARA